MKYAVSLVIVVVIGFALWAGFFRNRPTTEKETVSKETQKVNSEEEKPSMDAKVVLETNYGTVKAALDYEAAPKTAENFAKLVTDGFYDGLTFHRVIDGFMIQGGDPKGDGTGGPGYTVPAEIKLPHIPGAIAMARLPDQINSAKASSGSQFFIVLSNARPEVAQSLDEGGYTVFGQVSEGMDVVDMIGKVRTGASDKPAEPVVIKKAYFEN